MRSSLAAPALVASLVKMPELFAATPAPASPLAVAYSNGQTRLPGLICWLIAFCSRAKDLSFVSRVSFILRVTNSGGGGLKYLQPNHLFSLIYTLLFFKDD